MVARREQGTSLNIKLTIYKGSVVVCRSKKEQGRASPKKASTMPGQLSHNILSTSSYYMYTSMSAQC